MSVDLLRRLFDLVVIAGYFVTVLALGSWLMVAVPIVLAGVVIAAVVAWEGLGES